MTMFQQSDWTATIVAAGTSGTIRKSPDPSSPCEGAGPPDYSWATSCTCRQGRLRGCPGRRFGRGSALLFLVGGCLVGTKPFTQKAVIDDCLDMLALSTRNIKIM